MKLSFYSTLALGMLAGWVQASRLQPVAGPDIETETDTNAYAQPQPQPETETEADSGGEIGAATIAAITNNAIASANTGIDAAANAMAHTQHGIIWGFDDYPDHVTVDSTEGNEGWSIAQT